MVTSYNQPTDTNMLCSLEVQSKKSISSKFSAFVAASVFVFSGCTNSADQVTYPVVPDGLKDCSFFELMKNGRETIVVRCPNSSTSANYKSGKTSKRSAVIDGVEYEEKEVVQPSKK